MLSSILQMNIALSKLNNIIISRCIHTSSSLHRQRGIALLRMQRKKRPPYHKIRFVDEVYRKEEDKYDYPEEIPEYPPGKWGSMDKDVAWKRWKMANHLERYDDVLRRYQEMYDHEQNLWYHSLECPLNFPETLSFFQFISRTTIATSEPKGLGDSDSQISDLTEQLKILLAHAKTSTESDYSFIPDMMDCIHRWLAPKYEHLSNTQIDEGGLLETFVKRYGYEDLKKCEGVDSTVLDEEGCVKYRIRSKTRWQMRSRTPLPPLFSPESAVTTEEALPRYDYDPSMFGLEPVDCHGFSHIPYHRTFHTDEFLINKPGFWPQSPFTAGDPCEFGTFGVVELPSPSFLNELSFCEPDVLKNIHYNHLLGEGLMAGFTMTSAQAWNQGFSFYRDITYPFTTQIMVTDGHYFFFLLYQLNSLAALSRGSDSDLPLNMMWASKPLKLFDSVNENGEINGWNEEVVQRILDGLKMQPISVSETSDLRPFLQIKPSQDLTKYMNFVGEKEIEHPPPPRIKTIGRPHPNEIFYMKMAKRKELLEDIRKTFPNIGKLPEEFESRADRRRRIDFYTARRQKTEKGPMKWR